MVSSRSICKFLLDLVYPNRCAVCERLIPWNELICEECQQALPFNGDDICPVCGKDKCIDHSGLQFDGIVTLMEYTASAKEAILKLKHDRQLNFAVYSAKKLAQAVKAAEWYEKVDIITAVPMHKAKARERGYNQAQKLAVYLARELNRPADFKLISRTADRAEQHTLKADERKAFADKVFFASPRHKDIAGRSILLCDDIYTTGSTLNSCAGILKAEGAENVYCAAIATTLLKD